MRRILAAALLLLASAPAVPAHAQGGRVPPRPPLPAAADTNDASAYFSHGVSLLEREPREAAHAFYWASRLNPAWADPLYARRTALLLSDKRRLVDYMHDVRRVVRSAEIRHADSLYDRAMTMDPFLYTRFDKTLFTEYLRALAEREIQRDDPGGANHAAISDWISRLMMTAPPAMRAWAAYSDGRMPEAVAQYERAIRDARGNRWSLYAARARAEYLMGADSGALADLGRAVAEWRRREDGEDDLVWLYQSKALLEHRAGMVHERMGDPGAAREAYGRALQEDLSYYPAHVRLARLALAAGDTATALSELDLAVQVRGDAPGLRTEYGVALAGARRYQEAVEQFQKALELEPLFALPHFYLARIYDGSGMTEEAAGSYDAYLARAARREAQTAPARQRLDALRAQAEAERTAAAAPAAAPAEVKP